MQLVLSALRSTYDVVIVHLGRSEAASAGLAKACEHAVFATTADRPEGVDIDACDKLLAAGAPDVTLFTVDLAAVSAA